MNISEYDQDPFWKAYKDAGNDFLILQSAGKSEEGKFAHTGIESQRFLGVEHFSGSAVCIGCAAVDIFDSYYLVWMDACNERSG